MSPDVPASALAPDGARLVACDPVDGAAWSRLLAALPEEPRRIVETAGGKLRRRAVAAERDGELLGLAFGYSRPFTDYVKLALLWTRPEADALAAPLLGAFERLAAESGAGVVKLEQGEDFPLPPEHLAAAGFHALPRPVGEQGEGQPAGWARPLRNSWPSAAPPYYWQTTGMTCGPCALGMALRHAPDAAPLGRREELALWREATTIYAPAGPGGCDPFGLAVAARKRGLEATVWLSSQEAVLLNRAATEDRREVMRYVQELFRAEAAELGVAVRWQAFEMEEIGAELDRGSLAILLIDEDLMHAEGGPHWVLAHARYGEAWLVNDPWIDRHLGESWVDGSHLPIPVQHLDRMCWYGEPAYRSAVVLRRPA